MIIHHVDQGTDEWWDHKLGIPSSSEFDRLITKTLKPSTQATRYCNGLLAQWLRGTRPPEFESQWMGRGKYLEDEAVAYYEVVRDMTTDPGGWVTTDDGLVGCSPDRLVYAVGNNEEPVGGLEIKCPSDEVHMGYVMGDGITSDYAHQVQGSLWITGLPWWDTLSYSPGLPPALVRVEPDLKWQAAFEPLMESFLADLAAGKARLLEMGYTSALDAREAA
jgi:hypothetical protein